MVYIYKGKAANCQPLVIAKLTFGVGIFDIQAERMRITHCRGKNCRISQWEIQKGTREYEYYGVSWSE